MTARRIARGLLAVTIVAGIVVAFAVLPIRAWMTTLATTIRASGALGVGIYAGVYQLFAVFMLPGSLMSVTGGFAYGAVGGVLVGNTLAALCAITPFLLGRFVAREWVQKKAAAYPKLGAIDAAVKDQGLKVVALLRLSLAPYNFLNYAMGLTSVKLLDFVIGTWLGMLPAVTLLSYLGSLVADAAELGSAIHGSRLLYWGGFITTVIGVVALTRMAKRALDGVLNRGSA